MSQTGKRVQIRLTMETLVDIVCQLPREELMTLKQKVDEQLRKVPQELPPVVNDPNGEFWSSEVGQMILAEADNSVSIEEVRQILSNLKGSLAADIIAERGER